MLDAITLHAERTPLTEDVLRYLNWRHRIPLGKNFFTPGTRLVSEWNYCHLPVRLDGKTFLDVGANDGMYSFEAEKRGASAVTAADLYVENTPETFWDMTNGWNSKGIRLAKEYLHSHIEIVRSSVYDLEKLGKKYDYVYCANVLAWLENPLGALKQLAGVAKETLHLREDMALLDGEPVLLYVHDPAKGQSCIFNPNRAFLLQVLTSLGFKKVEFIPVDEVATRQEKIMLFPYVTPGASSPVYKSPWEETPFSRTEKERSVRASARVGERIFLTDRGWVNLSDVKMTKHQANEKAGGLKIAAKNIFGKKNYQIVRNVFKGETQKPASLNYAVIASR